MPMAIKAPPWSTAEEIRQHDEQLQQFEAVQVQRYGSASYRFANQALGFALVAVIMAGLFWAIINKAPLP